MYSMNIYQMMYISKLNREYTLDTPDKAFSYRLPYFILYVVAPHARANN